MTTQNTLLETTNFAPDTGAKLTIISNPSGMLTVKREILITRYHGGNAVYKEKGAKRMGTKEFIKRSWLADEMVFEGWDLPIQTDSEFYAERFCHLDNKLNVGLDRAGDEQLDPDANVHQYRLIFLRSFVDTLQLNANFTAKLCIMVAGDKGDERYTPLYGMDSPFGAEVL